MKKMIAYCGLDCEKCDAYLATIHNVLALREKPRNYARSSIRFLFCRSISTVRAAGPMV